ncbi:reverse transcriptase domain-containing protein [Tanacetum coccineum]
MADHLRPMKELLRISIVGIENAIVVPVVLADEFELKTELLDFISNNPFFGLENDDPHSHIKRFYQITQTFKINQVPHDVVKLILFLFSLNGAAETWLENEPPNSITSWDDLVSKFLNRLSLILKQESSEKKSRTFNKLCQSDQDSLNSAAGGNLMMRNIQEALTIIENKAKVQTCRNKPQVSSSSGSSIQNDAITALTNQVEALRHHISSMQEAYN